MSTMQWEGITEFVAVAEVGSFTQAAKQLGISTAQVSRQVSALEQRLKVKLLYRTTRKVSLSHEGQLFHQHCRGVLDGLEAAERAVTNLQTRAQGKIKLTAPATYGVKKLVPLINRFAQDYPDIEIEAYFTNQQIDLLEEGYDIAVRVGVLRDSSFIARRLTERSVHVCGAPEYLTCHGVPNSLHALSAHNCLLGNLDFWRFHNAGREQKVRVSGSLRYNSGEALLDAALRGLGLVQLPDYYVQQHLDSGRLQLLLTDYEVGDQGVWAVYPQNRQLSPRIRLLVDYLAEHLPTQ